MAITAGLASFQDVPERVNAQAASDQSTVMDTNTRVAGLRVAINSALKQHVDLAAIAMRDGFKEFGGEDFKASTRALDKNSVEIAEMVGIIYGSDVRDQFLDVWRKHIDFYINYTVATRNNDRTGKDKAMSDLGSNTTQIADLLGRANPNLQKNTIKQLAVEHAERMLVIIDAYSAGERRGSYDVQNDAYDHIGRLADELAAAIVKQFPEKFQ